MTVLDSIFDTKNDSDRIGDYEQSSRLWQSAKLYLEAYIEEVIKQNK
jgi:hypothetical protein